MSRLALVLYSGGLDSTTCLAWAKVQGFEVRTLSFHYGQRHDDALRDTALYAETLRRFGVKVHHVIDLPEVGAHSSSLVKIGGAPRKGADPRAPGIPDTYVPARNLIFLSWAVSIAEEAGITDIVAGMNAVDWSGYPDCRPEFIAAFQEAARLGTKTGAALTIHTPFIDKSKADIIRWGLAHGVDYSLTSSCYDPDEFGDDGVSRACGLCDSCQIRLEGFKEAGVEDPIPYDASVDLNLLG